MRYDISFYNLIQSISGPDWTAKHIHVCKFRAEIEILSVFNFVFTGYRHNAWRHLAGCKQALVLKP
jgi:hypothetical protein